MIWNDFWKAGLVSAGTVAVVFLAGLSLSETCNNGINGLFNLVVVLVESFPYAGILLVCGVIVALGASRLISNLEIGPVASNMSLWGLLFLAFGWPISVQIAKYAQQAATETCVTGIPGMI